MLRNRDKRIESVNARDVFPALQRALDTLAVRHANLVPGDAELPDFPIRGKDETPAESRRFKAFVERNLPRTQFADLRAELDMAARSKVTTPVMFYRSVVETRQMLRSAVKIMDWLAGLEDRCPVLRICAGCGRIFAPSRKDKKTCSTTCRDRIRQKKWRDNSDLYKANRIRKENEAERQLKGR